MRRKVATKSGGEREVCCVGINAHTVPIEVREAGAATGFSTRDIFDMRYAYDQWFYLAFLPVSQNADCGDLPINYSYKSVPLRRVEIKGTAQQVVHRFGLGDRISKELWGFYLTVRKLLVGLNKHTQLLLPLAIRFYSITKEEIYELFDHEASARGRAVLLRSKFMALLAFLSYVVCLSTRPDDSTSARPSWYLSITNSGEIAPVLVEKLFGSWVCDFSKPRVGAFVDITRPMTANDQLATQWFDHLAVIIKRAPCVPLIFVYGDPAAIPKDAYHLAQAYVHECSSAPPALPKRWTIEAYRQRNMTFLEWWEFLAQYEAERKRGAKSGDLATWAARARDNATHPVPKKHGPTVWRWTRQTEDEWTCEKVTQKLSVLQDIWSDTTRAQRRYSDVLHQWHFSEDLESIPDTVAEAPPAAYGEDDDEDEYERF